MAGNPQEKSKKKTVRNSDLKKQIDSLKKRIEFLEKSVKK